MKTMNEYTLGDTLETVNVTEFRDRISHLQQIVLRDRYACANDYEKAICVKTAKRVGLLLINTNCKRAKTDDWKRRETIIERSTKFINNHIHLLS